MSINYEDVRRAADMAPSILNTRPWRLSHRADDGIELRADWERSLKVIDPRHRELVISCGAALFNVRLAIRVTGHDLAYSLAPFEQDPDDACPHCGAQGMLASVEIALHFIHPADEAEQRLYEAIPRRHTAREPFAPAELSKAVELELAAEKEGVQAKVVHDQKARRLLEEAARASREQSGDAAHREELRAWTGEGAHVSWGYGVPVGALAQKPKNQRHPPVRDLGLTWDTQDKGLDYEKHSRLIALTAQTDRPPDWLRMGQALQRLLLTATRYGLQASLLTQQCEVDDWRRRPSPGPTMIIRFGYARTPALQGRFH